MPRTLSRKAAAGADLRNRRVTIRHPEAGALITRAARKQRSPFKKVRVHDVSQGGIALVLRKPPAVGEWIFLQLTNRDLEFSFDLAGEVRNVRPGERGSWIVGLQFEQSLSPGELATLL